MVSVLSVHLKFAQLLRKGCSKTLVCRTLSRLRVPYAKLREKLAQYDGGAVDLNMDDKSGLATVTINNPEKRNAFTGKMIVDFDDCVRELENWDTGTGVLLTGKGSTFCSGGDLNFVKEILDKEKGSEMNMLMNDITFRFLNLPVISVAAISGSAVGGGAELTTACDFRIMSKNAKISFFHVKIHVAPSWGGATRLVKLIGRTNALQLLASGKVITADLGRDLGLVSDIVPDGVDTLEHAQQWLLKICVGNPAVAGVLKSMVIASDVDIMKALEVESQLFRKIWGNPAHIEAVLKKVK